MIISIAEQLLSELTEDLRLFTETGIAGVKKLSAKLNRIHDATDRLKAALKTHPFTGDEEEIRFFKYLKPRFYAERLYAVEVFTIEHGITTLDGVLKTYYERELNVVRRFFDQHRFLYQYYLLDGTELDTSYFMRGVRPPSVFLPDAPDFDPEFSTACDYLFARFICAERVQEYLLEKLYPSAADVKQPGKNELQLKWTGNKAELVELAYSLHLSGQINNGTADIAAIINWLEVTLGADLGRYYQTFLEIKARKMISTTAFLDRLRDSLRQYVSEGDAFKLPRSKK
jgi:hypothetical protein